MKKTLAFILTLVMLLGCMSVTAFATTVPSWSYDAATDTITINYEIPAGAEVGTIVPDKPDILSGDGVNIACIYFGWGMQDDDASFIYNGVHWNNALGKTITSGNRYGYIIMIEYKGKTVDHSNAKVILNGKTYTNLGNAGDGGINCQPFLIADFGELSADGEFSGGDFAETESGNKSGTTDITAIKAAPLSYKLVIPQNVPTITAAGVTKIGAPSVEDVKNATEKTVISYTASGTQLTLENSDKTMKTSYYTDSEGETAMPSTAIEVYKSKALVNPLTTLYVGVAEDDWNAADAGTYHATVTFNFAAEEKEPECEVDTETNMVLYRVAKIDDENVYLAGYNSIDGFDAVLSMGFSMPKNSIGAVLGTEYAVGDCFHVLEDDSVEKCIAPETHGLINEGNTFTSKHAYTDNPAVVYFVIAGTTYAVNDGVLSVHYGDQSRNLSEQQCSWTLDGNPLSDGDTGTISEGNAFVGTDLPD